MKILGIIPARCNSKGLRNKNIALIGENSLLERAILLGNNSSFIDDLYVSTDCRKYEKIAIKAGAKSLGLRDSSLAKDSSKTIDVVIDLIKSINKEYDYVLILQPTSPVRNTNDIKMAVKIINESNADSLVSVTRVNEPHPHKMKTISSAGIIEPLFENTSSEVPRQLLPEVYVPNGAIYLTRIDTILSKMTFFPKRTVPLIMESNFNIDEEKDLILIRELYRLGKINLGV